MASLAGYNPNASLLPSGGGVIQPMSGGGDGGAPSGYNASASLLTSASTPNTLSPPPDSFIKGIRPFSN